MRERNAGEPSHQGESAKTCQQREGLLLAASLVLISKFNRYLLSALKNSR